MSQSLSREMREPGPVLREQNARWREARARLLNVLGPMPKKKRSRPVSPFDARRVFAAQVTKQHGRRLFSAPILEIDENGETIDPRRIFMAPWKSIAREVAAKHAVTLIDLVSDRRDQRIVRARHEAFYRCRHETTMSLPQIGKRFGNRDHTTVLHGIKKHEERRLESVDGPR